MASNVSSNSGSLIGVALLFLAGLALCSVLFMPTKLFKVLFGSGYDTYESSEDTDD